MVVFVSIVGCEGSYPTILCDFLV